VRAACFIFVTLAACNWSSLWRNYGKDLSTGDLPTTGSCVLVPPAPHQLEGVFGVGQDAWVIGSHGAFSHCFGQGQCEDVSLPISPSNDAGSSGFASGWASAPGDVWVVGNLGSFHCTDSSTCTTVPAQLAIGQSLWSVSGSGPSDVWLSGNYIVMHCSNPSTCESLAPKPNYNDSFRVSADGAGGAWISGQGGGAVYHCTASPIACTLIAPSGSPWARGGAIWSTGPSDAWIAGSLGLLHCTGAGCTVDVDGAETLNS
jgi:hypothetical protein